MIDDLVVLLMIVLTLIVMKRLNTKKMSHFIMIQRMNVFIDRVSSQLHLLKTYKIKVSLFLIVVYLTQTQVYTGCLTNVHNLPIRRQNKDKSVQCLK